MVEVVKISVGKVEELVNDLVARIDKTKYKFVFGIPRGGCIPAQMVAQKTGLRLIENISFKLNNIDLKEVLFVDDIIDSGKTKEKYKGDFEALINKQTDEKYKGKWVEFYWENTDKDDEDIIVRMLERIGENPNRPGLKETPRRVVKMWKEIFRGYDPAQKPIITAFNNGEDGVTYDQMITDEGDFYSQCEHHIIPFFGRYYFAYVPGKTIIGLSKVARIVDYYSAKLQIQERLVKEILDEIERVAQPEGIALVIEGEHLCKSMRGVKKKGKMKTTDLRGCFRTDEKTRSEFMGWVNKHD